MKVNLPATLTLQEWHATLAVYEGRCAYCGIQGKMVQEHIVPVSQGGGYTRENIVPACVPCNSKKRDRTPQQASMLLRRVNCMILVP